MIQIPYAKPTTYIRCPVCSKSEHAVSHLPVGCRTRWHCDDCGACFSLEVKPDGVDTTVVGERIEKTIVTLRCDKPFTIEVEGLKHLPADDEFLDQQRYFYEESTCPTNFLGVMRVIDDKGDDDPHGLFSFVKVEPWKDAEACDS